MQQREWMAARRARAATAPAMAPAEAPPIELPRASVPRLGLDDTSYVGSIPEHCHRGIGPFLFEPFARHTAERVRTLAPHRLLETACGTGIVTRRLRDVLPDGALLVASDLSPAMLDVARCTLGGATRVEWTRADMARLQFGAGEFDTLVCQFGLMFAPDKLAAVREARRVLRRGGHYLVTTWAPLARNPVIELVHRAIAAMFPDDPPTYLVRGPFGYGDPDALADLLTAGGFRSVEVDVIEKAATSPGAHDLALGLVHGCPLVHEIERRDAARLPAVVDAVAGAIAQEFGVAPVHGRIAALVASAVA
jgi:ubiquinone/menaquinone biosynthesis C-methylase UbiE